MDHEDLFLLDLESVDFDDHIEITEELFEESSDEDDVVIEETDLDESFVEDFSDEVMDSLPLIVFVDEDDVQCVVEEDSTEPANITFMDEKKFKCKKCGKGYSRESFFKKHVLLCNPVVIEKKDTLPEGLFMGAVVELFKKSIEDAANDPFFNIREPGLTAGRLLKAILSKIPEVRYSNLVEDYAMNLGKIFYPKIKTNMCTCSEREKLFSGFYQISIDSQNLSAWNNFLRQLDLNDNTQSYMVHRFVLTKFFQHSLKKRREMLLPAVKEDNESEIKLTVSEEETLRYVAGYVTYSLAKSIKNKTSTQGKAVRHIIAALGVKEEIKSDDHYKFLDYTQEWIKKINRGGLYSVNNEFYIFIRRVENVARRTLNTNLVITYCGEDLRSILMSKFKESLLIDTAWSSLTRTIDNKILCEKMKSQILRKWINIRANSFAKCWIQIAKRRASRSKDTKKISEKGESSLRKSLNTASTGSISEKGEPSLRNTVNK